MHSPVSRNIPISDKPLPDIGVNPSSSQQPPYMPLGTAGWRVFAPGTAPRFQAGDFWVGRLPTGEKLGVGDDRHVLITGGTRGGNGTSIIIPNLCLWPGSVVVLDPKGENAMVTARRRGRGSPHCVGMKQQVWLLDPLGEVHTAQDDFADIRTGYNPLDALDAAGIEAVDEAGRIAEALVVSESSNDPFWEESARALLKGVILHVASYRDYANRRNLLTVRSLLARGKAELRRLIAMNDAKGKAPSAHQLLFEEMARNPAYGGAVAGAGEWFSALAQDGERTFVSVMQVVRTNTEFIEGGVMRETLAHSGFSLKELKTAPRGASLYLCLPQRYMETHYRWLRMMVTLIVGEMERTPGQAENGHRLLMMLDEFAALRRMRVVENAAAQLAGFGVKMVFVVQTLAQLKDVYRDNWETLVANAGTRIFFCNDDQFTRDYASRLVGETETVREGRSNNTTKGRSWNESQTQSRSLSVGESVSASYNAQGGGLSRGFSVSVTQGDSRTKGEGRSLAHGEGVAESIQKRPLITADEIGRLFGNPRDPAALVLVSGQQPVATRRVAYFQEAALRGHYDAHRDHPKPPTLATIQTLRMQEGARRLMQESEARLQAAAMARRARQKSEEKRLEEAGRQRMVAYRRQRAARDRASEQSQERNTRTVILTMIVLAGIGIQQNWWMMLVRLWLG